MLFHGKNLRKGRYSEAGRIYLVTTVTRERNPVFAEFSHGRLIVQAMRHRHEAGIVESLAYVIMPDHVHWLFALCDGHKLSTVMQSFKSYTGKLIAQSHEYSNGSVWQAGYHDHAVRREEDIRDLARYVVANPLRAGLVEKIGDYSLWDCAWL